MSNYTLTYHDGVKGFPSFYSYNPDWMIGMNNYFYTFHNGNLYRHNVNGQRNNFYGVQYSSKLQSVFNDAPLENKLFKTLNLEGDDTWEAYLRTDIQNSGYIDDSWFEKKEQSWYAFVRNISGTTAGSGEFPLRSLNGISQSLSVVFAGTQAAVNFQSSVVIGSIVSVGDMLYFANPPAFSTPLLGGEILTININPLTGMNQIIIETAVVGSTTITNQTAYFLCIKNSIAESHGVLGHYCVFDLENSNTSKVELFAVETEVMKSFP